MHKEIVEAYTPLAACLITYGLNVLVGTLLGLVVFLGNMLGSRYMDQQWPLAGLFFPI